jgi:hypothetical protein
LVLFWISLHQSIARIVMAWVAGKNVAYVISTVLACPKAAVMARNRHAARHPHIRTDSLLLLFISFFLLLDTDDSSLSRPQASLLHVFPECLSRLRIGLKTKSERA